jgi:hypothetical protein
MVVAYHLCGYGPGNGSEHSRNNQQEQAAGKPGDITGQAYYLSGNERCNLVPPRCSTS